MNILHGNGDVESPPAVRHLLQPSGQSLHTTMTRTIKLKQLDKIRSILTNLKPGSLKTTFYKMIVPKMIATFCIGLSWTRKRGIFYQLQQSTTVHAKYPKHGT